MAEPIIEEFAEPEVKTTTKDADPTESDEFVGLGFWKNHNCYKQFKVTDPFIFVKKLEKQFLLESDDKELYFFQVKDGALAMSMVNLEKINKFSFKEVMPLLPINGKKKTIKNDPGTWGESIHNQFLGSGSEQKKACFSQP